MTIYRPVLACALLLVLCACAQEETFDERIVRAERLIASSDYSAAIAELKSALLKDKRSAQARWLLGTAYLRAGDATSAEKELLKAIDLGSAPDEVVPLLAESLLAQGKYTQVRELQETGLKPSAAAALLANKALAARNLGERYEAITLVENALEKAPDSTTALLAKAQILVGEQDYAGAELVLENVMPAESGNGQAWSLLGDVRIGLNKPQEALPAYDEALAIQGSDYHTLFKRALLYLQLGDFEASQIDTTSLLRVAPQQPGANYVQGLIHYQAGRYAEAITPLGIAAAEAKRYSLSLFFLGCAQIIRGELDQAVKLAEHYQELVPDSIRGRKLLALVRLQQARYQEVLDLLEPVLYVDENDVDALNLMSSALLLDHRADEGVALLARLAAQGPDVSIEQVRLGAGRLLSANSDDAAQYLETSLALRSDLQHADALQVMRLLHRQDHDGAVSASLAYRRRNPIDSLPHNLLGMVYLSADASDKARESFGKALRIDAGDPLANHNLAQLAIADGDLAAARKHYLKVLDSHGDNLTAALQLASLDETAQREESQVANLKRAKWKHVNTLEPRLLLGRHHLSHGHPELVALQFMDLDEVRRQLPQVIQLEALAKLAVEERAIEQPAFDMDTWDRRLIAHWVSQLAPAYGLDPKLILAVIQAESNFNPGARSPANALGLMQLIPATAARFGVRDRADPVQNLHGGMAYLRWLLSFFDGDIRLSLAGYNAGEGAVLKYLGIPPYPETQHYVRKVMRLYGRNRHPRITPVVKPTRFMPSIRAQQFSRSL